MIRSNLMIRANLMQPGESDDSVASAGAIYMLDCGNNVLEPAPEEKPNSVAEATVESAQASAESASSEANPCTV